MGKKVMVFGSFVVDLMARAPHLPSPGQTVKGSLFKMGPGGKGYNQAVAAHKAGSELITVTKIGEDNFGKVAIEIADELKMNKKGLIISKEESTGIAIISVDENTSQNQIVIVPGACASIKKEEVDLLEDELKTCAYILLQLEVNQDMNEYVVEMAKRHGVKVILNTAPYQEVSDAFLSKIDLVTPNEVEAFEMTGVEVKDLETAKKAAKIFYDKGVKEVIITLGEKGVFVSSKGKEEILPAYKVKAVDTTGAGDAFNGGLLTALSEGKDIFEAAKFANALAALSVQKIGTAPAMPTRSEIESFMKEE